MEKNELQHYGILGMKWGVRRSKAQLRRARGPDAPRKVSKEQYEAAKKNAIDSGDVNTVRAWEKKLSKNELDEALKRIDMHKKLYPTEEGVAKSGAKKVKSVVDTIGNVTKMTGTVLAAYGTIAKINNTFNKKQMISIDGTYYKDQKEKKEKS